jgi:hypothetical protein
MVANANATLMGGPGGGIAQSDLDTMCEAFEAAVNNFCSEENKASRKRSATPDQKKMAARRGRFNDFFYRSLAARDPALAGKMRREVAGVFTRHGSAAYLGTLGQVAKGAGQASGHQRAAARFMNGVMRSMPGHGRTGASRVLDRAPDAMRGATVGAFRSSSKVTDAMRQSVYTRWSDGTLPSGRQVEIKGPGDAERKNQFSDLKKMGRNMQPVIVGCTSCGLSCEKGCP